MNFLKRTFKIGKKKTIKKVPDVESLKEKVSIPVTDETIQTSLVLRQAKTYLVNLLVSNGETLIKMNRNCFDQYNGIRSAIQNTDKQLVYLQYLQHLRQTDRVPCGYSQIDVALEDLILASKYQVKTFENIGIHITKQQECLRELLLSTIDIGENKEQLISSTSNDLESQATKYITIFKRLGDILDKKSEGLDQAVTYSSQKENIFDANKECLYTIGVDTSWKRISLLISLEKSSCKEAHHLSQERKKSISSAIILIETHINTLNKSLSYIELQK
jgi:hypothetical protein